MRALQGEERKRALAEPGPPWREWALATGLKPWVGLGLLILDALLLASLLETSVPWTAVVAIPPLLYADFLCYAYLWARPPKTLRHSSRFRSTWHHPFLIGRWEADRSEWTEGSALTEATAVPPEEFL